MKSAGRLVFYTDKSGNVQYGRTYNSEELMNGKVIVHLMNDRLNLIKENGQDKKVLVEAGKLTIKGFID